MKDPSNLVLRVDKSVDVEVVLIGTIAARSQASARRRPNGLSLLLDSHGESASAKGFLM
jgi:hypothetical protein